jgi:hypothetical protein
MTCGQPIMSAIGPKRTCPLHKDMCQSVAKLSWIFWPISVQDPCLVQQQMRDVLLE